MSNDDQLPRDHRDLTPILTDRGRQMLLAAAASGKTCRISHVAIGSGNDEYGYEVTSDQTELYGERQRVEAKVQIESTDTLNRAHVTAVVGQVDDEYPVYEVGFFLSDEDEEEALLFAIWAAQDDERLLTKSPGTDLLLAFELALPEGHDGTIEIRTDALFDFPDATDGRPGVVRLATKEEVTAAEAQEAAVSPATLKFASSLANAGGTAGVLVIDENGRVRIAVETDEEATHALQIHQVEEGSPGKVLRLVGNGDSGSGARFNFGDADYVYLDEPADDYLRIHGRHAIYLTNSYDDTELGAELGTEDGPRPNGVHLRSNHDIKLSAKNDIQLIADGAANLSADGDLALSTTGSLRIKGSVHIEGDLEVTKSISSSTPKFRKMWEIDARTTTDEGWGDTFEVEFTTDVGGDFLILASFEGVRVDEGQRAYIELDWQGTTKTAAVDLGGSPNVPVSASTHFLKTDVAAGQHTLTLYFQFQGTGKFSFSKGLLSVMQL